MSRETYARRVRWRVWVRFGVAVLALLGAATVGVCEVVFIEPHRTVRMCESCAQGEETLWLQRWRTYTGG